VRPDVQMSRCKPLKRARSEDLTPSQPRDIQTSLDEGALPSPRDALAPGKKYRGVYEHRSSSRWQAYSKKVYLGLFSTQVEAAQAILAHEGNGATLKDLAVNGGSCRHGTVRIGPRLERFTELLDTFGHCLPGDLEAAFDAYSHPGVRKMYDSEPLLEVLSIQGKTGPWKLHLFRQWEQAQAPGGPDVQTSTDYLKRAVAVRDRCRV
jgi:hypothetical protein